MGIPAANLFKVIPKLFPKAFSTLYNSQPQIDSKTKRTRRNLKPLQYQHVYFDLNSLLHELLPNCTAEIFLVRSLYERLNQLLELYVPTQSIGLILDGSSMLSS
jgi:hypothetical protein